MKFEKLCLQLLLVSAFAVSLPSMVAAQCGGERWSVKIGRDADAGLVNLSSPTATTLSYLTTLAAPDAVPDNNRVQPTETTVWVINATLKQYQKQADSDYHLLLVDGLGHQMIAEIPSPGCMSPSSPFYSGVLRARADFDAKFSASSALKTANVPVQITGVGFFDYLAGQTGVAPNGIELHPIIDIVFSAGNDFSLTALPANVSVTQGGSTSIAVTTAVSGTFSSNISLSVTGLPAGVAANLSPATIAAPGSGSSNLSITAGANTPAGTYNLVITASSGDKSHSANINLTVNSASSGSQQLLLNPGLENGVNSSPWIATTGVVDNSTLQPARTGSWKAWMNGFGVPHSDTLYQQVSIPNSITKATLSFWIYVYTAETSTSVAYDKLSVQIRSSSGATLATLANFSNLSPKAPYAKSSFDISAYKGQTIQIYLAGVEDQGLQTSFIIDDFALDTSSSTVEDFAISVNPGSLAVTQGGLASASITTTTSGNYNSNIALNASGLPVGAAAAFNPTTIPSPGAGSAAITIATSSNTPAGSYVIVVTGTDGNKSHSANINLTVNSAGSSSQQLLLNPGLENGLNSSPWIATTGVIDNSTLQPARTGSWKAWMNGFGVPHSDTLYQQVSIPNSITKATLSFWIYVYTAEPSTTVAYDKLSVQIRSSSGATLATLANFSNLSPKTPYAKSSFDISAYKGQTIQIYLVGVEDQGLQTSFIIDDFALDVNF